MSYRGKTRARRQPTVRLTSSAQVSGSSSHAGREQEVYRPALPQQVEEQHHDATPHDPLGQNFGLPGDGHRDYYEQFDLSDIGTAPHGHDDRPPYTTMPPFTDDDATEPPEDYIGDDSGPVPDTHLDAAGVSEGTHHDGGAEPPLKKHEIRTISK